jgi:flagellar capping protein FliD
MPAEKIVEKLPSWIERILLPSLNEIKGEIKAINTRIDSLDDKMDTKMTALDGKIDSLRNEINSKFVGMDYRFEAINTRLDSIASLL